MLIEKAEKGARLTIKGSLILFLILTKRLRYSRHMKVYKISGFNHFPNQNEGKCWSDRGTRWNCQDNHKILNKMHSKISPLLRSPVHQPRLHFFLLLVVAINILKLAKIATIFLVVGHFINILWAKVLHKRQTLN